MDVLDGEEQQQGEGTGGEHRDGYDEPANGLGLFVSRGSVVNDERGGQLRLGIQFHQFVTLFQNRLPLVGCLDQARKLGKLGCVLRLFGHLLLDELSIAEISFSHGGGVLLVEASDLGFKLI